MVYKSGKLKGQLTTAELRKLVRGHNKLYTIKIPKGATQPQIIKLINDKGYNVNHEKGKLVLGFKTLPKTIEMKDAPVPKKKTEAEKMEMKKKKEQKEKELKKKEKDMRREQIQRGRDIQKKIDMVQKKKKEKKALARSYKPLKPKKQEDPTHRQALNNAQSIIDMFEKHGGKIKDSDFTSRKELAESVALVKNVLKDPSGLSPGKINFLKKAIKLHEEKPVKLVIKKKKDTSKNDKEPVKPTKKPITLNTITRQYLARIFADAMDDKMGTKEVNKNKELYNDIQSNAFSGDKIFKLLNSKSKTTSKKRNKIIEALNYFARDLVGDKYKEGIKINALYDMGDVNNIPLGIKFDDFDMGAVDDKDLKLIGELVETFTPYKMEMKEDNFGFSEIVFYRFVKK